MLSMVQQEPLIKQQQFTKVIKHLIEYQVILTLLNIPTLHQDMMHV